MNLNNTNSLFDTQTSYKKKNRRKELRVLLSNISMFLLNQEKLKDLLWSVKSVDFNRQKNFLKIGINSTHKLGTVLAKLRTLRASLAEHLKDQGLTGFKTPKIEFVVDRDDEVVQKIYNILENIQQNKPDSKTKLK